MVEFNWALILRTHAQDADVEPNGIFLVLFFFFSNNYCCNRFGSSKTITE